MRFRSWNANPEALSGSRLQPLPTPLIADHAAVTGAAVTHSDLRLSLIWQSFSGIPGASAQGSCLIGICFDSRKLVCGAQEFASAFADDDAGSHGVSGRDTRHDRAIGDAKVFDSIDLKLGVYHRHRIAPHLGSTRLMEVSRGSIANEVL